MEHSGRSHGEDDQRYGEVPQKKTRFPPVTGQPELERSPKLLFLEVVSQGKATSAEEMDKPA